MRKGAGRGEMCGSPPPTVVLACSWVSSTGVVACLCVDELLLWPCERCWGPPRHFCCCFSERGRGSVPGPRRSLHGPTLVADPTARCSSGRFHSRPTAANQTVTLIIFHRDEVRQAGVKSQEEPSKGGEVMERWRREEGN